ncbi:hypothetical protein JMJ06_000211 [Enterococcus faecalis]|nr:hypothetical protein [Enterococcus faecalis]
MKQLKTEYVLTIKELLLSLFITLLLVGLALFLSPIPIFAESNIESSITTGSESIYTTVKNVSGGVAIAIIGGSFLVNMLPNVELSQKAKSLIWKAGFSLFGIAVASQIVEWIQGLSI